MSATPWQPPSRSRAAQDLYDAADVDRAEHPDRYRLDLDRVVERASRGAGHDGFSPGWREGLAAYLASAEADGRLNALGARVAVDTAVGRLKAGAAMGRLLAERPQVADVELAPPIVVIGGWRTGTTFLYRLLATDTRLRAPLPAELAAPWRMVGLDPAEREARIRSSAAAHDLLHLLNPQLRAIHDSGPHLPEECVLALGSDMRNWGFTSTIRLDGYARWLADQDMGGSYRRHRQVLQALAEGDPRRFVLKAPAHTAELAHLVAALPGVVVVHLHRDIVETLASGSSLFAVFRSTYSDHVDAGEVGRAQADQTELWLRRALAFRATPAAREATFVDVRYRDLVADTPEVLRRIYEAAAIEPPDDVPGLVARYHAAHPRHDQGTHRYTAAEFGLQEGEIRERFAFYEDLVQG